MGRLIKWVLVVLFVAVLCLTAAAVYLTQVLDPNDFKSDIEALAEKQGVPLRLNGDVSWKFFPQLALELQSVELATGSVSLASIDELAAAVDIGPLLEGRIAIEGVLLRGVRIHAVVDESGRANWDFEAPADTTVPKSAVEQVAEATTPVADSEAEFSGGLALAIQRLVIEQASVHFEDRQTETNIQLENWDLTASNINLINESMALQTSASLQLDGMPPLNVSLSGDASFDGDTQQLQLPNLLAQVTTHGVSKPMKVSVQGDVDVGHLAPSLQVALSSVNLADWLDALDVDLPPMAAKDALQTFAVQGNVKGSDGALQVDNLKLVLDKTHFSGSASMTQAGALSLSLKGNSLDVDRYLPPADPVTEKAPVSEKTSVANKAESKETKAPSQLLSSDPLPLDSLRDLDASVQLSLQQLTASGLTMENAVLSFTTKQGRAQLKKLSADFYEGTLSLTGSLNVRPNKPVLTFKGGVKGLALEPLMKDLKQEASVLGRASINIEGNTRGNNLRAWQQYAVAKASLIASSLTVKDLDVEKSVCEVAAQIKGAALPEQEWKGETQLEDVAANLSLKGTQLKIESIKAGLEYLQLTGKGSSDYISGDFDVIADVVLSGQADAERACQLSDRWRNKALPLRCKGNIDTLGARTCGPDKDRLGDLLKDEAKSRAKDKLQEKIEKKLGTDLGSELLKGWFGR